MTLGTAVVAFGAALKADPQSYAFVPAIKSTLEWMQNWAWLVVVLGPLALGALQWSRRRFGNPWAWEGVQKLLDEFREVLFKELPDDPLDHHRVTLFKYFPTAVGWGDPHGWKCRLVAVARSNHLTKHRIRRFHAPDDGDLCEGVVGMAWRRRNWVIVPKPGTTLPVLNGESVATDIEQVAKETGVGCDWIRQQLTNGRPLAASYAALTVQLKGQPWGVLVVDSRCSNSIDPNRLERFMAFGNLLTPLLERT